MPPFRFMAIVRLEWFAKALSECVSYKLYRKKTRPHKQLHYCAPLNFHRIYVASSSDIIDAIELKMLSFLYLTNDVHDRSTNDGAKLPRKQSRSFTDYKSISILYEARC